MVFVILIAAIVLAVSLYNFFDSRDAHQLTMTAYRTVFRDRDYGALKLMKTYNRVFTVIMASLVALFGLTLGSKYTFFGGSEASAFPLDREYLDTALLSLYAPPEEQQSTLPPSYSIKSDSGNGGPSDYDQEETQRSAETPQKIRDEQQDSPTENRSPENPQKKQNTRKNNNVSQDIQDMKSHTDDVLEQARKRKEEREKKAREKQEAARSHGANQAGSKGNEGSAPKVKNFADFDLEGRTPFNNDNWYLQYPVYLCPDGGTATVKIKVDGGGNVKSAKVLNADNLPPCIVEYAEQYAKKARFNSSSKEIQEGTLTYRFKAQ